MPKQEVAFLPNPATLLKGQPGDRSVLLDGRTGESWGDGLVIFAERPTAVLEVSASQCEDSPLESLQEFLDHHLDDRRSIGVAVVLSYDLKHAVEQLDRRLPWPASPVIYAAAFAWAYSANRRTRRAHVIANSREDLVRGLNRVNPDRDRGGRDGDGRARTDTNGSILTAPRALMPRADYRRIIEAVKDYIRAGDIYQANLAQAFHFDIRRKHGAEVFDRWTSHYPTPYAAYVDGGDWSILCNSPECFLDLDGNRISTFPIKGTRAIAPDRSLGDLRTELASDPKELAEHLMIVDLERNDLGRLCQPGSVRVPVLQKVCEYPMLMHMVSEVTGRLRPDTRIADILAATFPGGSITGAPKIRAMQIIEELEPIARGFYTGSVGWISPGGSARFNIAIRSGILDDRGLSFHAGGGIVADSDPDTEYRETYSKLRTLFRVLTEEVRTES